MDMPAETISGLESADDKDRYSEAFTAIRIREIAIVAKSFYGTRDVSL
jgi:hypothetical protein